MSTQQTWSASRSSGVCPARFTNTCAAIFSSWRTWPNVNERRNVPNVDGARIPVNNRPIPPWRSRSRSSMLSAPATIPATTAATFTPEFGDGTLSPSAARSCNPQRPARASTGTSPADDTRFGSSNATDVADNM
jgi:hypothetical protein